MRRMTDDELSILRNVGERLGRKIEDRIASRREDPELWYHFHDHMLRTLPRRRVVARAIHRMLRRRMRSWMHAQGELGGG